MKESYVKGVASHSGPESCVCTREVAGEALTGVRVGRVLSREIYSPRRKPWADRGAETLGLRRRPHRHCRNGEAVPDPARSETPCTRGNTLLGNREIPRSTAPRWEALGVVRIVKPEGARR
jgi:hypothetical protein